MGSALQLVSLFLKFLLRSFVRIGFPVAAKEMCFRMVTLEWPKIGNFSQFTHNLNSRELEWGAILSENPSKKQHMMTVQWISIVLLRKFIQKNNSKQLEQRSSYIMSDSKLNWCLKGQDAELGYANDNRRMLWWEADSLIK